MNEREEIYLITTFETSMAIESARWQFDSRGELATGAKKKKRNHRLELVVVVVVESRYAHNNHIDSFVARQATKASMLAVMVV